MADDLGYADVGCFGQRKIKTPILDHMATEGIRFTQAYCGTSVCAPSRCILMTGLHAGHSHIRANRESKPEGQEPLLANTFTVARMLQQAGYRTACFGKWGLGGPGSTGEPNNQGFDHFFGYLCQRQAHEYYPDHLWRNGQRVELDGKAYSHDLIVEEAFAWVRDNCGHPFFLYLPFTIPHAQLQVPELGSYDGEDWSPECKAFAAMVARMDRDIGRLITLLKELGLDERTIVFFTSDNGTPGGKTSQCFESGDSLRGIKREMYEGGLRVPMIVRWPGRVPAGKVSDEPWAFWDFLPTCADLAGVKLPDDVSLDGQSVVPALLGGPMPRRDYFYWELHEPWSQQAVRFGDIKAVRPAMNRPIEVYDLAADASETHDLAGRRPDLVAKAEAIMKAAHVDSALWPEKLPRSATRPASRSRQVL
jgi:arylsulfatase A-like enzyme